MTGRLYPLFLRLRGRRVLVVGAGSVGARKVEELLAAEADVRVVAARASEPVRAHAAAGRVHLEERAFRAGDEEGAWLVIAATNDPRANAEVTAAAEARRIFVNAVDDPPNASAYFAARLERPPFTIAISSGGAAPALSRLMRELLESVLPTEDAIRAAERLRAEWRARGVPIEARFDELVRALADARKSRTPTDSP